MSNRPQRLIQHETVPPESVIDLLKNTYIGTEGTLYQLLDTEEKIHTLLQPHFLFLERNQKAIFNIAICERSILLNNKNEASFYIRYVAFDTIFQGGLKKGKGRSSFHQYFNNIFKTSNLDTTHPRFNKAAYWAYIDPQNMRSFNLNTLFGFETIGQFKTTAFSRVNPKKRANVNRLIKTDQAKVMRDLTKFYQNFQFFSPHRLFENDNYFVLKKNGEIVCGIHASPVHWRIRSLPGLSGKFLLNAAPYIPRIRKLINPKNHRFLATEGIFWTPGNENCVSELLEGILAETNHNSLLIWTDDNNNSVNDLQINWGFIQRSKKDNRINIVAKFNAYTPEEIIKIKAAPKYLSGFDMT